MKRLVSILIAIMMLVSLCPTALADDAEALKKRIEELEAEIEKKDAIIAEKDAIISALASSAGSKSSAGEQKRSTGKDADNTAFDDAIFIEEVNIEKVRGFIQNGLPLIRFKMKIKNQYVPVDGENFADSISWDAQILSKSEDVIETLHFNCWGVDYGDTVWENQQIYLDLSEVSAVRVKTYRLYKTGGSNNSIYLGSGKLSTSAFFNIDDIDINTQKSVQEDFDSIIDDLLKGLK